MPNVVVQLFGRRLPLKTESSQEHIDSLVAMVDARLRELDPEGAIPEMQRAILTLLNLADELSRERDQSERFRQAVLSKSSFLLEKLESSGYAPLSRSDLQGGG